MDKNIVAEAILRQLGGNKFIAMTGATNLVALQYGLQFKLPRGAKDGINKVMITLNGRDLYDIGFMRQGADLLIHQKHCMEDIYAEDLRRIFTEKTGLEVSL